jgi:membrane protein DedA with SNARE-associated domain
MDSLIAHWGYLAVLAGAFFEGETAPVAGGFAAHRGLLSYPFVVLAAFVGSTIGDQLWFLIGRRFGSRAFARRSGWAAAAARAVDLLRRYDAGFIFAVRFLYGLRIAGPIAIGAAGVSRWRFTAIDMASAAVWANVIVGAGWLFGDALERLLHGVAHREAQVILAIGVVGIFVALAVSWHRRRR